MYMIHVNPRKFMPIIRVKYHHYLKTFASVVNNESVRNWYFSLSRLRCTEWKMGKIDDKRNKTGHIRFSAVFTTSDLSILF